MAAVSVRRGQVGGGALPPLSGGAGSTPGRGGPADATSPGNKFPGRKSEAHLAQAQQQSSPPNMKFLKYVGGGRQGSGHAQSFSPGHQGPCSAANTLPAVGGGLHPTAYSRHAEVLAATSGAFQCYRKGSPSPVLSP